MFYIFFQKQYFCSNVVTLNNINKRLTCEMSRRYLDNIRIYFRFRRQKRQTRCMFTLKQRSGSCDVEISLTCNTPRSPTRQRLFYTPYSCVTLYEPVHPHPLKTATAVRSMSLLIFVQLLQNETYFINNARLTLITLIVYIMDLFAVVKLQLIAVNPHIYHFLTTGTINIFVVKPW